METILSSMDDIKYLFIDDVLITGIVAKGITHHYDWSTSFLESHTESANALLSSEISLYIPELLAAMNMNSQSILLLYKKSKNCYDQPRCYSLLERIQPDITEPRLMSSTTHFKFEL